MMNDLMALLQAAGQGEGAFVLVLAEEKGAPSKRPPPLSVVSVEAEAAPDSSLLKDARACVEALRRYRGPLDAVPQGRGAAAAPVWLQGTLVAWIFGYGAAGSEAFLRVATECLRSVMEVECLRATLEQSNSHHQKTVHDLKSFATGFMIASEMWSKPNNRNLDQLGELAVLSYNQARQMLVALENLSGNTFDRPIPLDQKSVSLGVVLEAAGSISRKLLDLPPDWAPAMRGDVNVRLCCDAAKLGPAVAALFAVVRGAGRGPVNVEVKKLPDAFQIVIQGMGARAKGSEDVLRDERFLSLDRVNQIIKSHGGSVDVQISKKMGHCFTLRLPTKA